MTRTIETVECFTDDGTYIGYLLFRPYYTKILAYAVWPDGTHHGAKEFSDETSAKTWLTKKAERSA